MKNLRAASVQFNHIPGDKQANFEKIRAFVGKAAADKVELIVLPEMCITGYWHVRKLSRDEIGSLAEPVPDGPSTRELLQLSKQYNMTIGAGLIEQADDGELYNSYVVAMPDEQMACHRKLHCFISEHMASGSEFMESKEPRASARGI